MKNEYLTKDLYEAAFIYASGLVLLRLERYDKQYFFVFQEKSKAEKLRDLYWSKNGTLSPKIYSEAIKSLKERIFANERNLNVST